MSIATFKKHILYIFAKKLLLMYKYMEIFACLC